MSKHRMYVVALVPSVAVAACATQYQPTEVPHTSILTAEAWQRSRAAYDRQDYLTAFREWLPLAQQGQAPAQYNLGLLYAQGQGVAQDDALAVRWYWQAAAQGHAPAQVNLGVMYEHGRGVSPDLVEAQRWYPKAAELFPPGPERIKAIEARDRVARQLTANQVPVSQPTSVTPPPPISASPPPPAPRPALSDGEEISLIKVGGVYELPVEINGVLTLKFVLDSGAAEVNLPADVVLTLVRTGTIKKKDFLPGKTYTLADGQPVNSERFLLRSLKIGHRHVANVAASIGPVSSPLLLGQSFLEKLGAWGINSQRQVLTLGIQGQRQEPTPHQKPPHLAQSSTSGDTQVAVEVSPAPAMPQILRNSIGMEFVRIPAGTFQMGANSGDKDEKPVHTVHISQPFYLGKYEVTQEQWQAVMGNNPSRFKGDPTLPVEFVSWDDIQAFISKLNAREGGDTRYRLPTEAEWEYAARAGTTTTYSFGNDERPLDRQLGKYAWYSENSGGETHPVGQRQPNQWGLYDMHGNVWEWVQDGYGWYSSGTVTDPIGPHLRSYRMYRGGSWYTVADHCRVSFRAGSTLSDRLSYVSFRVFKTAL